MIRLQRVRDQASVIAAFRGEKPRQRLVRTMKKVREQLLAGKSLDEVKLSFESEWSGTKDQLLKESHHKCAYCETSMLAVAFGDVEHYRPKSRYWWLAYVYDNYLASCAICNQRFKSDRFEHFGDAMVPPPVSAQSTDQELSGLADTAIPDPLDPAAVSLYEQAHRSERPRIPNPYIDDPEAIFGWEVLDGTREVEAIARPGVADGLEILDACERIYGINRPDLKRRRYEHYDFYKNFARALRDLPADAPSRPGIEALVASMKEPPSQYAAMIRFLAAQEAGG